MNKAITGFECYCVMEAVRGFRIENSELCYEYNDYSCGECIAKWLNEEARI